MVLRVKTVVVYYTLGPLVMIVFRTVAVNNALAQLLTIIFQTVIPNGVREKEGSGTSPLTSVSDGNLCPTENYIQQQQ